MTLISNGASGACKGSDARNSVTSFTREAMS